MFKNSKTHIELAELLVQAQEGSKDAFAEIYSATVKAQYYLALKTLKDEVMAEDVTQEVFVYLLEHLDNIKFPIALVSYMNKTNYHLCLKALNKNKLGMSLNENVGVSSDSGQKSTESVQNLLESAMFELEPKMKEVVVLKYIQEFKTSEIAKQLNLSQRTVQRMIKNGLGEMKKNLSLSMGREYGFVLFCLPFMSKIINQSMQKLLPVEVEARMLAHVVSDVSLPVASIGAASVLSGTFIEHLTKSAILKIAIGTTAITGVVLTTSYFIPPQFKILGLGDMTKYESGNQYRIQPTLGSSIKQVIVYDEHMKEYINYQGNGEAEITITNNGKYTVKVVDMKNHSSEKSIEVVNIDVTCPSVKVRFENDHVIVGVNDNESGIDFHSITITSDEGNPSHSIDIENNEVTFNNAGKTQMSIKDKLGNETVVEIDKEILKEIK